MKTKKAGSIASTELLVGSQAHRDSEMGPQPMAVLMAQGKRDRWRSINYGIKDAMRVGDRKALMRSLSPANIKALKKAGYSVRKAKKGETLLNYTHAIYGW